MRLVAFYIMKNSLKHVFGSENIDGYNELPRTINLGGKYLYNFEEVEKNKFVLKRDENKQFINDEFWKENKEDKLSLVSAIVGANGIGKTSLLRYINSNDRDPLSTDCLRIFEIKSKIIVYKDDLNGLEITTNGNFNVEIRDKSSIGTTFNYKFYSPMLDFDLIDAKSSLALVSHFGNSIDDYFYDSVHRNFIFLSNEKLVNKLKELAPDFPQYDSIQFSAKKIYKSELRKANNDNTLGNTVINFIRRLEDIKNKGVEVNDRLIELLKKKSDLTTKLNDLWNVEKYKNEEPHLFITNNSDFLKDVEVTILSFIILNETFSSDNDERPDVELTELLKRDDFLEMLIGFLHRKINTISAMVSQIIYDNFTNRFSFAEFDEILEFLSKLEDEDIQKKINSVFIEFKGFMSVFQFWSLLKEREENIDSGNFSIQFSIENKEYFNTLMIHYRDVVLFLKAPSISKSDILNIKPAKKLSSGEKSILDFFSSLYSSIEWILTGNHYRNENFILLLDEPDLGFHPLWKKKLVNILVKLIPIMFERIPPLKDENGDGNYTPINTNLNQPNLQIIFSTHDPLTLSDLPKNNICFLKNNEGLSKIIPSESMNSFGANITDLLSDSFFIDDGLIGDFAKQKINECINWLKDKKKDVSLKDNYYKFIKIIDEPILRNKLAEMFDKEFESDLELKLLKRQKENLEEEIRKKEAK